MNHDVAGIVVPIGNRTRERLTRLLRPTLIDRPNLRASLWSILYCFLLVAGCGLLLDLGVSFFVVVPVGLFVFPLLASIPFFFWLKPQHRDTEP